MSAGRFRNVTFALVAIVLAGGMMPAGAAAQAPIKKAEQAKLAKTAPVATHKVAIQVNQNDKAVMDLALNNAKNVIDYYWAKGETVAVEIVTYGPGLHMLRADTSPVKERIAPMALENSNLAFIACGNTQANQSKAEGKPVTLLSEAKVMPSGVVRLMELQKQGYAYIRP
jgi:intracellular sulfur oxidation DsrE/DsrF family protein